MILTTLKSSLNQMRYDLKIGKEINTYLKNGRPIEDCLKTQIVEFSGFEMDKPWWLEKFFKKLHLPFIAGAFLVYFVIMIPDIFFSYSIAYSKDIIWAYHELFARLRDILIIVVPLILMNQSHKKILKLKNSLNEYARKELFKTPIYSDKINQEQITKTDKYYFEHYIKPISFKTLQGGFDLSHKASYCIGSAIITGTASVFLSIPFPVQILEPELGSSLLGFWQMWIDVKFFILWAILGMLTWSAYISLNIAFYSGYYVIDFIPQKPLRKYYQPIFNLGSIFWITGSVMLLVILPSLYVGPYVFEEIFRDYPTVVNASDNFVLTWLMFVTITLAIGVIAIFYGLRYGMSTSKHRKLVILESKIAELKEKSEAGDQNATSQYTIALNDYKDLISNNDSPTSATNVTTSIATLIGPPASIIPAIFQVAK